MFKCHIKRLPRTIDYLCGSRHPRTHPAIHPLSACLAQGAGGGVQGRAGGHDIINHRQMPGPMTLVGAKGVFQIALAGGGVEFGLRGGGAGAGEAVGQERQVQGAGQGAGQFQGLVVAAAADSGWV